MIGKVISKSGKEIRLTAEMWSHIVESHDYMAGNQDMVFETLDIPDIIVSSGKNEFIAIKHYIKTSISEKHVIPIFENTIMMGL